MHAVADVQLAQLVSQQSVFLAEKQNPLGQAPVVVGHYVHILLSK